MGGKIRQSKVITAELVRRYNKQTIYVEPFCGALGSAEKAIPALAAVGVKQFVLSDVSKSLITMWRAAVFDGWSPPKFVSEKLYYAVKRWNDSDDPLTAYCGFGISFAGKWFGGYVRGSKGGSNTNLWYRMHENQQLSVLRKAAAIRPYKPEIVCLSCFDLEFNKEECIVYLDPPYENRTKAHNFKSFSHKDFWKWAAKLTETNDVIVTGFEAPPQWRSIYNWGDTVVRHHSAKTKGDGTCEQIFEYQG